MLAFGDEVTWEDVDAFDVMLDAEYEPYRLGLEHVSMAVADKATLARAKAYACDDIGVGRTEKDAVDLVSIVRSLGARTPRDATRLLPWLADPEFDAARAVIGRYADALAPAPEPTSPQALELQVADVTYGVPETTSEPSGPATRAI